MVARESRSDPSHGAADGSSEPRAAGRSDEPDRGGDEKARQAQPGDGARGPDPVSVADLDGFGLGQDVEDDATPTETAADTRVDIGARQGDGEGLHVDRRNDDDRAAARHLADEVAGIEDVARREAELGAAGDVGLGDEGIQPHEGGRRAPPEVGERQDGRGLRAKLEEPELAMIDQKAKTKVVPAVRARTVK
ncbi:MAG: hypothetical protein KatS3mg065_0772 [Chloroflexota bacterium]|nr:MAG: hypothetical protein KatS3mg065_0772 [Chloroflexota bacterium]